VGVRKACRIEEASSWRPEACENQWGLEACIVGLDAEIRQGKRKGNELEQGLRLLLWLPPRRQRRLGMRYAYSVVLFDG
jgi:hypothetical protein